MYGNIVAMDMPSIKSSSPTACILSRQHDGEIGYIYEFHSLKQYIVLTLEATPFNGLMACEFVEEDLGEMGGWGVSLCILRLDERGNEYGLILVFDDMDPCRAI